MDMTMADDLFMEAKRKGRSASICAPSFSSMEAMLVAASTSAGGGAEGTPGGGTPDSAGTPAGRRRRPATRSQSARISGNKSVRRRQNVEMTGSNTSMRSGNSEPRLNADVTPLIGSVIGASGSNTPEASPAGRRRTGTSRRATSMHHTHTGTVHRDHTHHRKSTAFLDVPDLQNHHRGESEDEDSYRLRSFSSTSKGVVNRGDSFRRRRSRSNSLLPMEGLTASLNAAPGGSCMLPPLRSPTTKPVPASVPDYEVQTYRVAMMGSQGVGKTALISQFMTSECINAYDRQRDIPKEQSVSIMLNGEESELQFVNISNIKELENEDPPAAIVMMYSVIDKASVQKAEQELQQMQDKGILRSKAVIVVANKVDLVRSRAVSTQDGKCLACTYRAKFIEISVGINHNVDELLVGILTQIRLKAGVSERDGSGHWYKNRGVVRASMKARQMFTWIFGREDSKFKNCENLHVV